MIDAEIFLCHGSYLLRIRSAKCYLTAHPRHLIRVEFLELRVAK